MPTAAGKGYLLDTSAVLAFLGGETGCRRVASLLRDARAARRSVALSCMTLFEVYYVVTERLGREKAAEAVLTLKSWRLPILYPTERLLLAAGRIKAAHRLSAADAIIAATAAEEQRVLVHRDPEFDAIAATVLSAEHLG